MTQKKVLKSAPVIEESAAPVAPVEETEPAAIFLSRADLFQLMWRSAEVEKLLMAQRQRQLEGQFDEKTLQVEQEKIQRLQAEFSLRNQARNHEFQQLEQMKLAKMKEFEALKLRISKEYGVDFSKVTIDDETGKVTFLPEVASPGAT